MKAEDSVDRFVSYLERLRDRGDRGALAELRRGLGNPPGTAGSMHRHVVPWAPSDRARQDAYYVIGSLFAWHPHAGGYGNLGTSMRRLRTPSKEHSVDRRFTALLDCHTDDMPNHLRQVVSLLKSHDIPVEWRQLLHDVLRWNHDGRFVQRQWAVEFWASGKGDHGEGESGPSQQG